MAPNVRLSAGLVGALLIGGVFAILGIVLIVIGWSEAALWQTFVLQTSWLCFDAAVLSVVWHVIRARNLLPARTERFRHVWLVLLGTLAIGVLVYAIAFLSRHAMLTPLGQLSIALGLFLMVGYLAATSLRPNTPSGVEAIPELDDLMTVADDPVADTHLEDLVGELTKPRHAAD